VATLSPEFSGLLVGERNATSPIALLGAVFRSGRDCAANVALNSYGARNFHYGIREHAMGAIFTRHGAVEAETVRRRLLDLLRPDARRDLLSAIMRVPVLYVFTHDSIGVGEDGPTHQPVQQFRRLAKIAAIGGQG